MATEEVKAESEKNKKHKKPKKGFETQERLTLRIDSNAAEQYQARKDGKKNTGSLPKKFKKLNKKVRDSYDEDEEDDYEIDPLLSLQQLQINHNDASNGDNSLINALNDQERRQIMQSTNIEIKGREENAGKQDALEKTDTLLRKSTLPKMDTQEFTKEMNAAIYNPRQLRREALERNIAKRMGIEGKITEKHEGNVVRGVKKLKTITKDKQTPNLKMEDVQKIGNGKMTDNQTAELILKKSGQTARLSELKHQVGQSKSKDKTPNNNNKSYSKQMKEILREALKKNNKVH